MITMVARLLNIKAVFCSSFLALTISCLAPFFIFSLFPSFPKDSITFSTSSFFTALHGSSLCHGKPEWARGHVFFILVWLLFWWSEGFLAWPVALFLPSSCSMGCLPALHHPRTLAYQLIQIHGELKKAPKQNQEWAQVRSQPATEIYPSVSAGLSRCMSEEDCRHWTNALCHTRAFSLPHSLTFCFSSPFLFMSFQSFHWIWIYLPLCTFSSSNELFSQYLQQSPRKGWTESILIKRTRMTG